MHTFLIRSVWLTAAFLRATTVYAADGPCQRLEGSTPGQQVRYLQGDRSGLQSECIVLAIGLLRQEAYIPAADVLTTYLDFRVVKQKPRNLDFDRLPWMEEYPAAHALFAIGPPATDSLVRAIANAADSSDILRTNAEEVLLAIHSGNPSRAVGALRRSGKSTIDAVAAARLFESAMRLSRKCADQFRSSCEAALN